eukprot:CAMPEP_0113669368 /NCGR_PEP_ID=MMETSP0038_2-20120614/4535_1 /TAXON_ID=2898 /ORGANISM="Cryptomonas paramecium" /LENGTH=74 /DNA_ID=CAMNT_0000585251 /DNA_START=414 /DNA_END=635 /DNA_ORIENTATION=+ /assembly_acc=CAM_ASM_000170
MLSWCYTRGPKPRDLCGVGITFESSPDGSLMVHSLVPGSPADACGRIARGDVLYEVDGRCFFRADRAAVSAAML